MSSLRLALKLSMMEEPSTKPDKKKKSLPESVEPTLDDVLKDASQRKRKASFDSVPSVENRSKPPADKTTTVVAAAAAAAAKKKEPKADNNQRRSRRDSEDDTMSDKVSTVSDLMAEPADFVSSASAAAGTSSTTGSALADASEVGGVAISGSKISASTCGGENTSTASSTKSDSRRGGGGGGGSITSSSKVEAVSLGIAAKESATIEKVDVTFEKSSISSSVSVPSAAVAVSNVVLAPTTNTTNTTTAIPTSSSSSYSSTTATAGPEKTTRSERSGSATSQDMDAGFDGNAKKRKKSRGGSLDTTSNSSSSSTAGQPTVAVSEMEVSTKTSQSKEQENSEKVSDVTGSNSSNSSNRKGQSEPFEHNCAAASASTSDPVKSEEVTSAEGIPKRKRTISDNADNPKEDSSHTKDGEEDDSAAPRYQSSRAAAMAAKTKLSAREQKLAEAAAAGGGGAASRGREKKDKGRTSSRHAAAAAAAVEEGVDSMTGNLVPPLQWVQCEQCEQWRSIPSTMDASELPDEWYCRMNTWNEYNSCEVGPEPAAQAEGADDDAAAAAAEEATAVINTSTTKKGRGSGRGGHNKRKPPASGGTREDGAVGTDAGAFGSEAAGSSAAEGASADGGDIAEPVPKKRRDQSGARSRREEGKAAAAAAAGAVGAVDVEVNWVQCNKCSKWRKVPATISPDDLPDVWYCSQNTWNPSQARCSAREETDDASTSGGASAAVVSGEQSSRKGGKRQQQQQAQHQQQQIAAEQAATISSAAAQAAVASAAAMVAPKIKKIQWVQCERANCKKWRKVPAYIDIESLGAEKWFCEMNTWDPDSATCTAREDSDSEDEQQSGGGASQFIVGNTKGANALSYRRIIFGTDGKIRLCFSGKNKQGYGLFSYTENSKQLEDNVEPVRRINYWWSSVYDHHVPPTLVTSLPSSSSSSSDKTDRKKNSSSLQDLTTIMGSPAAPKANASSNNLVASATIAGNNGESFKATTVSVQAKEPAEPTFLLDSVRRMYGLHQIQNTADDVWPAKRTKSLKILRTLSVFERERCESAAIKGCFTAKRCSQMLFPVLLAAMDECQFVDEKIDACRGHITAPGLLAALRRLEAVSDVEITYSASGVLQVELMVPLNLLVAQFDPRIKTAIQSNFISKESGLPLKLRKFANSNVLKPEAPETASASITAQPDDSDGGDVDGEEEEEEGGEDEDDKEEKKDETLQEEEEEEVQNKEEGDVDNGEGAMEEVNSNWIGSDDVPAPLNESQTDTTIEVATAIAVATSSSSSSSSAAAAAIPPTQAADTVLEEIVVENKVSDPASSAMTINTSTSTSVMDTAEAAGKAPPSTSDAKAFSADDALLAKKEEDVALNVQQAGSTAQPAENL